MGTVVLAGRIELQRSASGNDSGVGAVHDISQNDRSRLRTAEQRAVVSDIALDMPTGRQLLARLGGGAEVKIDETHIYDGRAVESAAGRYARNRREDH